MQMPGMDGCEATRHIRTYEEEQKANAPGKNPPGVPIIAMTANVMKEDVEKAIDAGMNAHLGKPIELGEIFKVLKKYLN